jgi:hypothetical protein
MIIAVAVQTDDGWTMSLHPPARHADLIVKACKIRNMKPFRGKQGFINDKWEFLTREEAAKEAIECGQIEKLNWPPNLFSEDLW